MVKWTNVGPLAYVPKRSVANKARRRCSYCLEVARGVREDNEKLWDHLRNNNYHGLQLRS